jgi:hypothetical protein
LHTPSRNAHKHTQVPLQRAPSTSYWHWPDPSPTFTLQVTGPPLTRAQCRSLAGPPYTCSGRHFAGWLSHPPALVVAEQLIELRLNGAPLHTPPHPSTTQDNIGLTPSSHIHKHTQVQWLLRLLALAGPSINGTPSTSRPRPSHTGQWTRNDAHFTHTQQVSLQWASHWPDVQPIELLTLLTRPPYTRSGQYFLRAGGLPHAPPGSGPANR